MKNAIIFCICIILLFMDFSSICFAKTPKQINFSVGDGKNYPAYGPFETENSNYPGWFIEAIHMMQDEVNIPIRIIRVPWKRALVSLERGNVDIAVCGSYKLEREKYGVYPKKNGKIDPERRFTSSRYFLYVLKSSPLQWDGKTLNHLNGDIGVQLGYSITDDLIKLGAKIQKVAEANQNFLKLEHGRIAALAAHEDTGNLFLEQFKQFKRLEIPLKSKPYFLIQSRHFYKKYPALSNQIWEIGVKIRKSMELEEIKRKYYKMENWD